MNVCPVSAKPAKFGRQSLRYGQPCRKDFSLSRTSSLMYFGAGENDSQDKNTMFGSFAAFLSGRTSFVWLLQALTNSLGACTNGKTGVSRWSNQSSLGGSSYLSLMFLTDAKNSSLDIF
ncbi:Hypothetical_protein [Hexamita inflata]|uniref:Hypothetical_protein n=1 Tax=Hexamita inflata TaxID=28002 RepID=A0AA86Q195_9EUKA|nr:Hypothetical protein HINF_LOCUS37581 [Hexamita inflata]